MGKLGKFFKKQPGGAPFWNIVRGIGDKFTGGMVSSIIPRTPGTPGSADSTTKNSGFVPPVIAAGGSSASASLTSGLDSTVKSDKKGLLDRLKENWIAIVSGLAATGLAIWYFTRKPKYGKRR